MSKPKSVMPAIIAALQEVLEGDQKIKPSDKLADLELDSLDFIDLVFDLEHELEMEIPAAQLEEVMPMTVEEFSRYIEEMRDAPPTFLLGESPQ